MGRMTIVLVAVMAAVLGGGCAGGGQAGPASTAPDPDATEPQATRSSDPWAQDLAQLDSKVRELHPNPFVTTPEAQWVAKLEELEQSLPTATPDQQIVQLVSLIGLLDTHSELYLPPFDAYDVLLYPFADGWFVVRARDTGLVGLRVVSIGGHPIAEVESALRPLVPADNESGELDGLQRVISIVEYLHGLGVVEDPAKPAFVFARPDGTEVMVDLTSSRYLTWETDLGIIGGLMGDAPESVDRRREAVWTRLDEPTKTFVISYNDYTEEDLQPFIAEMKAALDAGSADRVLVDMRYVRGGNGSLADPLVNALAADGRINRPGGLIVMIGRENVSAGTKLALAFDRQTQATLVGEMTPARADGFLCECVNIDLVNSGLRVQIPTFQVGLEDQRPAIEPDVPFALTSTDFFAGRDPALEAALALDAAGGP